MSTEYKGDTKDVQSASSSHQELASSKPEERLCVTSASPVPSSLSPELRAIIAELRTTIIDLNKRVSHLESKLEQMRDWDHPITIREAMCMLEQHICIAIVGSKTQAKKQYLITIKTLQKKAKTNPTLSSAYNSYLETHQLQEKHLNSLLLLKKIGNRVLHKYRAQLPEKDLLELVTDDDDDEDDKVIKLKLFSLLSTFATSIQSGG